MSRYDILILHYIVPLFTYYEGEFYILHMYIISTSKSWNILTFSDVSELFEADVNHAKNDNKENKLSLSISKGKYYIRHC